MKTVKSGFCSTQKLLSVAIVASLVSPLTIAAEDGFYAGANMGRTREDIEFGDVARRAVPTGASLTGFSDSDRDTGYKVFGGYQFNKYFALEGGYFDLGEFNFDAATSPPGALNGNLAVKGWNIDAVGFLPLTEKFSAFGRVGLNAARSKNSYNSTGIIPAQFTHWDDDTNHKYGLGLQYAATEALNFRLEAERFRVDEPLNKNSNIDMVSAGVVYRFGKKAAPAPAAAPVAAVVAAPRPAAPPAATPPPAPPAPRRITLSADSLFDFDGADVKVAGRQELDMLVTDLKTVNYDVINVTGHTDRIGSESYNLALSARRANAVKAYLVQAGLPAAKITARGVDGSSPVTRPGDCQNLARPALITCLQPDRRVEVEVSTLSK